MNESKHTGNESKPNVNESKLTIRVGDYLGDDGGASDGKSVCTKALQQAIDDCAAAGGGRVVIEPGTYLTGALFLRSQVELSIEMGAELRGVQDDGAYPVIRTRVAGVEMDWPSGLLNVCGCRDVRIAGKGLVNGQGDYWWEKYWGADRLGGMRADYTKRGLRWAVDYDCRRPRNLVVMDSRNVELQGLRLIRSPFWNVHICYSEQVHVDDLYISENHGPSTDGVDIDSSRDVLVENCFIACNDDNVCIKAGRDADGLRVNRPCESIVIRDCVIGAGAGITIGSETSGGVRDVEIYRIKAVGTDNGFRLKSARTRGGRIERIHVREFEMVDVRHPFSFQMNWNPSYSYAAIPADYTGPVPDHWKVLAEPVEPPERGIPECGGIIVSDITVRRTTDPHRPEPDRRLSAAFQVEGCPEKPIRGIRWSRIGIEADLAGSIAHAADWTMDRVTVRTARGEPLVLTNCERVELPEVRSVDPPRGPAEHGAKRPVRVYLAGDSTVQTYSSEAAPQAGWGQYIADFFLEDVAIHNHAIGGRSSRTFVEEGRLAAILRVIERGDYLFIQMGHNDATKIKPERYTDPKTRYKDYLLMYIQGARACGAVPILLTPVGRLHLENGAFVNDFQDYCEAMKQVAEQESVPVIDLMAMSLARYASIGWERARGLFMVSVNGADHTHFTERGAKTIAALVARGVKGLGLDISDRVRAD